MRYIKIWKYNIRHKWYVMLACFENGLYLQGLLHDWDKFLVPRLWIAYARKFYGTYPSLEQLNRRYGGTSISSQDVDYAFDFVWLEHKNRNKHHWQYWVTINDDGSERVFAMPYKHRLEMVCDWIGAGKAQGHFSPKNQPLLEVGNWYIKNRKNMRLHPQTRRWVEEWLGLASLPEIK